MATRFTGTCIQVAYMVTRPLAVSCRCERDAVYIIFVPSAAGCKVVSLYRSRKQFQPHNSSHSPASALARAAPRETIKSSLLTYGFHMRHRVALATATDIVLLIGSVEFSDDP